MQFGKRSFSVFVPFKIFMGTLFMTPTFYHNWRNGFSGGMIYDSFYYAFFGIIIVNFAIIFYVLLDQDVDYNFEKYGKILKPADPEKQKTYDPTNINYKQLVYKDRIDYLDERGISYN